MAANRYAGEVEITLDKRRILKLTIAAAAKFSDETGITIHEFMFESGKLAARHMVPREDHVAALLWALLSHEDRLLTVERAAELMDLAPGENDIEKVAHVSTKCFEAWCNKQGLDFKKLMKDAEDARAAESNGGIERPLETKTSSPAS